MKNRISNSLIFGVCSIVVATASYALIAPTPNTEMHPKLILPVPQAKISDTADLTKSSSPSEPEIKTIQYNWIIEPGDSLSSIFSKLNLSSEDLHKIIFATDSEFAFNAITPGNTLHVKINLKGQLEQLTYQINLLESLVAQRVDNDFVIETQKLEVDYRLNRAHAVIHNSLFEDGKKAGLPDKTIMQLSQIFAWDIDFATNLHDGDEIIVLYEKLFANDVEMDTGDIVAAKVINQGRVYSAIRFVDKEGKSSYYTPEGKSMRKAFLRNPVDFARISSGFNLRRKHPILHKIRAHKGVDFAAKTGTPVKVTGDGKITFIGRKGGYGRVIIVQHGKRYSTLYAHLQNYARDMRKGSQVKQGQVIGFVGQSGLASGPHLHYEFQVDGKHRNPLTVPLPKADPIERTLLVDFRLQAEDILQQLNNQPHISVAQNGTEPLNMAEAKNEEE